MEHVSNLEDLNDRERVKSYHLISPPCNVHAVHSTQSGLTSGRRAL
jgi:hypothetical protein